MSATSIQNVEKTNVFTTFTMTGYALLFGSNFRKLAKLGFYCNRLFYNSLKF